MDVKRWEELSCQAGCYKYEGVCRCCRRRRREKASRVRSMASTASSALRSLNATFVRKGIVAGSSDALLPAEVASLLEALKKQCQIACENAREIANSIQFWKERSLHHTLQSLDGSTSKQGRDRTASGSVSALSEAASDGHERQIQAIEDHEKAGREINEMLQRYRVETTKEVHSKIDIFSDQLAEVLNALIKPEVEEELERGKAVVERLVQEKQKLDRAQHSLVQVNQELRSRIESLENAPDGGGDAILCNKLRERVKELSDRQQGLLSSVDAMEKEREKCSWDMIQAKKELELQQRTLLMTKAMHEKETKQLVDLVQNRQAQFAQVMQATSNASRTNLLSRTSTGACGKQLSTLAMYDPVSGHTIQYASKSPQKPGTPNKTKLVSASSLSPKRKLQVPNASQQQSSQGHVQNETAGDSRETIPSEPCTPTSSGEWNKVGSSSSPLPSPTGYIRRPFSLNHQN